jgi:hypothetical protein
LWCILSLCTKVYCDFLLTPIPLLGPFEKWGVDLMGPLHVTRKGHWFIVVATNYFIKFAKVHALKFSMK